MTQFPIITDQANYYFESDGCSFGNLIDKFRDSIKNYSDKFSPIYETLESNGYKLREWFPEGEWDY